MRIVCFLLACALSTLLSAQEVKEVCPQATPPGWVVISTRPCAGCCGLGIVQMLKIRHIENDSERAHHADDRKERRSEAELKVKRIEVCPQAVPNGWVVVSTRPCAGCCGTEIVQMLTIEQVGTDSGRAHQDSERTESHNESESTVTNIEVCPQATPSGWVIVGGRQCAGCCNTSEEVRMLTIKRIDTAPQSTRIEMCPQETPPGWAVVGTRPCAGCCGTPDMEQMLTIEKL